MLSSFNTLINSNLKIIFVITICIFFASCMVPNKKEFYYMMKTPTLNTKDLKRINEKFPYGPLEYVTITSTDESKKIKVGLFISATFLPYYKEDFQKKGYNYKELLEMKKNFLFLEDAKVINCLTGKGYIIPRDVLNSEKGIENKILFRELEGEPFYLQLGKVKIKEGIYNFPTIEMARVSTSNWIIFMATGIEETEMKYEMSIEKCKIVL